jgi:N6-adenosine-specific RNA methylase IME4
MPEGALRVIKTSDDARETWILDGAELGARERSAKSLMWDIGDWWNRGEPYGDRAQVVTAGDWPGPKHGTCREAGRVAARWRVSTRVDTLTFDHHRAVSPLEDHQAIPLLEWAAEAPNERSAKDLRNRVKQIKRQSKEARLGAQQKSVADTRFGVIYADPPWRFEPYSRDTGMDRAADNHYPTMETNPICDLEVNGRRVAELAADDAVLFLWATAPMLPEAIAVMDAWGFTYKSHCVWLKDRAGTGFWFRNKHELLLVGTRGNVPAPAPGKQYCSVIDHVLGRHSEKPEAFAEIIEGMFPSLPSIELFARRERKGWDVWGNEAPVLEMEAAE